MTVLLEGPSLTGLTDHELAGMFGGEDDAAILAELARRLPAHDRDAVPGPRTQPEGGTP
jgi:hypothetical protein